jgi:hypothetical protein
MSDLSYNVVYEYDETRGGAYGVRTWTAYRDEAEYLALSPKYNTGQTPIALGATQDEAINLTSLTPEICRLMCAMEQAFEDNPEPAKEMVKYALVNARYAIAYDRNHISANDLERIDATKYIEAFRKMIAEAELTIKSAAMSALMIMCLDSYGQVL